MAFCGYGLRACLCFSLLAYALAYYQPLSSPVPQPLSPMGRGAGVRPDMWPGLRKSQGAEFQDGAESYKAGGEVKQPGMLLGNGEADLEDAELRDCGPQELARVLRVRGGKDEDNVLASSRESVLKSEILAGPAQGGAGLLSINATAMELFAESLNVSVVKSASKVRFRLPLIFDDLDEEISFFATVQCLALGSGWYEHAIPRHNPKVPGVPHRDVVLHALIAHHMEGKKLTAESCASVPIFAFSQLLNIPLTKEERLDGGPIRQDVPSDHRPVVDLYYQALSQTGAELMSSGFKSMADFIFSTELQGHSRPAEPAPPSEFSAALLVKRLATCLETFKDEAEDGGLQLIFHRKAQILCEELVARFGSRDPRLNFKDIKDITLGGDAETVAFLRAHGIIKVHEPLLGRIEKGKAIAKNSREELALRTAGARACVLLAESLSRQSGETVSCAEVWKYIDMKMKAHHLKLIKKLEEEEEQEEERVTEIKEGDEAETTEATDAFVLYKCKDTPHY